MLHRIWQTLRRFGRLYTGKRLPSASAALSFYLTMTLFPLLIILYTLLGNSHGFITRALEFARGVLAAKTVDVIKEYLRYVVLNNSRSMILAALFVLVTSASAAVRTLQATIGQLQGKQRFQGLKDFLFSVVFSLLFTAALSFAILVMLTGKDFFAWLKGLIPSVDMGGIWQVLRYPLLALIVYGILCGVYAVSRSHDGRYPIRAGAVTATAAMIGVCVGYSAVIGASSRYPLVYGSLASVILLMMWLYTVCLVIVCGAALNVALRDVHTEEKQRRFAPEQKNESREP